MDTFAYGQDRMALETLSTMMAAVARDEDRLRKLVKWAKATGFEFDD